MMSLFLQHRLRKLGASITLLATILQMTAVSGPVNVFAVEKAEAAAGIFAPINYQGRITGINGTAVADGQYNVRFKIFTAAIGGSPSWSETWNGSTQKVTMTGGLFSVALGTHVTMTGSVDFNTNNLYLQIEFDALNDGSYSEVFSPRRRFSSVPYAHNADMLDGLDASKFVRKDQPEVMSGTLTIKPNAPGTLALNVIGTTSGNIIHAEKGITSSGSITAEGTISGANLYVGTSIRGAGLVTDCDTAGSSKLLWDATSGRFSCGSDANTTYTAGQGLTLNGASFSVNSTLTGTLLKFSTVSGSTVYAKDTLRSSGTLIIAGNAFIRGTLSGNIINAQKSLNSSGSITAEGTISGANLYVGTSIRGAGLVTDCDTGATSKLLWDVTTGRFSCGTDQSGSSTFSTGNVLTIGNQKYVSKQGDTMTGALNITVSGTSVGSGALTVYNTTKRGTGALIASSGTVLALNSIAASGGTFRSPHILFGYNGNFDTALWRSAVSTLSLSGNFLPGLNNKFTLGTDTMRWKDLFLSGSSLHVGASGNEGTVGYNTGGSYLTFGTTSQANALTILNANGNVGIGTTLADTKLEVVGTISGSTVYAANAIRSSGSITAEGTISGANLYVGTSIRGAGLVSDCNTSTSALQWNSSTGRFSCGTISAGGTFSTGNVLTIGNANYVSKQGDTMTGALNIRLTSTTDVGLNVAATMSGRSLQVTGTGAAPLLKTDVTTGRIGIGTNNPTSTLDINDTTAAGIRLGNSNGSSALLQRTTTANTLSLLNYVEQPAAGIGSAVSLNGAADTYVDVGSDSSLYPSYITVSAWVYFNQTSGDTIIANSPTFSTNKGFELFAFGGTIYFDAGNGSTSGRTSVAVSASTWTHFVGTYDGTNVKLYKNGALASTTAMAGTMSTPVTNTLIGYIPSYGNRLRGKVDDVRIYNRAIDSTEVSTLYNSGTGTPNDLVGGGLAGWWNFDENTGTSAADTSGNGNTGTLGGSATWATGKVAGVSSYQQATIITSTDGVDPSEKGIAKFGDAQGGTWLQGQSLKFYTFNNSTSIERMRLSSGGLLGLGTTTPGSTLSVSGSSIIGKNIGGRSAKSTVALEVIGGMSGSFLSLSNNLNVTGAILSVGNITTRGMLSGATLYATKSLRSSGSITAEGTISGANLYAGTSIRGAGLVTDCDTAGSSKLLWDATTGRFSCGTDANTTYTAGQGLTLNGASFSVNSTLTGTLLKFSTVSGSTVYAKDTLRSSGTLIIAGNAFIRGTLSGNIINAQKSLNSSGSITAEGTISGASLYIGGSIQGAGLVSDCNTSTSALQWTASTGRFSCGTISAGSAFSTGNVLTIGNQKYVSKQGDTMTGALNITVSGTSVGSGALTVYNTTKRGTGVLIASSGTVLALNSIAASGGTFRSPHILFGYNGNFDTALWRSAANVLSLNGMLSGRTLFANDSLRSSGSIVAEGTISGANLYVGTSIRGAGLVTDCDTAGTSKLLWDATTGRFSCGTDADTNTTYTAGQGLTLNGASFSVNSTLTGTLLKFSTVSGSTVYAKNTLRSSGTLIIAGNGFIRGTLSGNNIHAEKGITSSGSITAEGTISGANLYVGTSIRGAGLVTDCDTAGTSKLLWDATTGRFSCGSDANTTYTAGQGLTLNGASFSVNSTLTGTLLKFSTVSGSTVYAKDTLRSSGTLIIAGNAFIRGTLSGNIINAQKSLNSSGSITAEGTISGANLYVGTSIRGAGLVTDCDTGATSKLLWDATSGRFSCGTDQTGGGASAFSSGNVLTIGDARYVRKSGDTMTGALNITVSGTSVGSGALTVYNTTKRGTGALIASSGTVLALNSIAASGGTFRSPHILFGYNGNFDTALWRSAVSTLSLSGNFLPGLNNKFTLGTDTMRWKDLFLSGSSLHVGASGNEGTVGYNTGGSYLTFGTTSQANALTILNANGNVGIGTSLADTKLEVVGTISGATIFANNLLRSSGSLAVESGTYIGGDIRFDQIRSHVIGFNGTNASAGKNLTMTAGDGATDGGTMILQGGSNATSRAMISLAGSGDDGGGINIYAADNNAGSIGGSVNIRAGTGLVTGAGIVTIAGGANSFFGDGGSVYIYGGSKVTNYNDGNVLLGINTAGTAYGNVGIRTLNPGTALEVNGTISGSTVYAASALRSSGSITAEGTISGANLYAGTSIRGAGLVTDCDTAGTSKLLWDATSGRFSCGTDQTGGGASAFSSGNVLTIGDARYVSKQGDTMTGTLQLPQISGNNATTINTAGDDLIVSGGRAQGTAKGGDILFKTAPVNNAGAAVAANLVAANTEYLSIADNADVSFGDEDFSIAGWVYFNSLTGGGSFGTIVGKYNTTAGEREYSLYLPAGNTKLRFVVTNNGGAANGILDSTANVTTGTWHFVYAAHDSVNNELVLKVDTNTADTLSYSLGGRDGTSTFALGNMVGLSSAQLDGRLDEIALYNRVLTPTELTYLYNSGQGRAYGAIGIPATDGSNLTTSLVSWWDLDEASGTRADSHGSNTLTDNNTVTSAAGIVSASSSDLNTLTSRMIITSSGTVGIGTITPDSTLAVSGATIINGKGTTNTRAKAGLALEVIGGMSGSFLSLSRNLSVTGSIMSVGNITTRGMLSGATLYATKSLRSSGSITAEGAISGASLYVGTSIKGAGLVTDCDTAGTSKLLWDATTGRFSCGSDANTTYTAGQGLTLTSTSFKTNAILSGTLLEFSTVSGSTVYAASALRSSGSITAEGTISGANLYIGTSIRGAGLVTDCDTAGTSKVLWDATTGRFSCGTDQSAAFSTGNVLTIGNANYVPVKGGTMTGSLQVPTINLSGVLLTSLNGFNEALNLNNAGLATYGVTRLQANGNLTNIGSIQSGEIHATMGGTFAAKADKSTGSNPYSVAIGDLNGDGKMDMAVANYSSTSVSVFLNSGNGSFATKVDYTTGSNPESVDIGDLNGDGYMDLAVANYVSSTLSIFINQGNGTFAAKVDYATGSNPFMAAVGDLNRDGKPDVAVVNVTSGTLSVFINNGNGTLASKVDYATATSPRSLAIGDLDGDGILDIAATNYNSTSVSVFLNKGNGTFATKVDYATGSSPYSVAIGDLDGDGKMDMAVANYNSASASVFINNGNGTFATKVDYATGSGPRSVAIGDLNGDGKMDMAVTNYTSTSASVLINNGNGTFATKVDYTTGNSPINIAINDLNQDGKNDLAIANYGSTSVSVLLNNTRTILYASTGTGGVVGIGTATPGSKLSVSGAVIINANGNLTNKAAKAGLALEVMGTMSGSALQGMGLTDCLTVGYALQWSASTGRFACGAVGGADPVLIKGSSMTGSLQTPAINMSGILLTAMTGFDESFNIRNAGIAINGITRMTTNGNLTNIGSVQSGEITVAGGGTFATKVDYSMGAGARSVSIGDLNGDGKMDFVAANLSSNIASVFMNNGNGTFATKVDYSVGTGPNHIGIGDINGDGKNDLISANSSTTTVSVLLNTGRGLFASKMDYTVGSGPQQVVTADFNGDGKLDIATTNSSSTSISVLINKGNNTFATHATYTTGAGPQNIALGDLNGDGAPDLAVTNNSSTTISVFINKGNGTFNAKNDYALTTLPWAIAIGDVTGDSKPDIVATTESAANVSVYTNTGTGAFATKVDYAIGAAAYGVTLADLNGDGKLDIATGNNGTSNVSVLLNKGSGTFNTKVDYASASTPLGIASGDLNGDGKIDLAVANNGGMNVSVFLNNGQTVLYAGVGTGGMVGIGTSRVTEKLTVSGSILIDTDATSALTNVFKIITNNGSTNNVVFRISGSGSVYADGKYNSAGADYAEWFYSGNEKLTPGEVVCIDITQNNAVKRCTGEADSNVMGIVSTNPAFVGNVITGADGIIPPGYSLIGLIGQVPAHVIVEGTGAIRPGDALTPASKPGFARKAMPGESTVGVALEGIASGEGVVNVLISRRNSSLTVDAVGQKVLDTIASMKISDEVQLMVASSLETLNVDDQIQTAVQNEVTNLKASAADILTLQTDIETLKSEIAALRSQTGSTTIVNNNAATGADLTASTLALEKTLNVGEDARIGGDLYLDGTLMASSLFVPNGLTIDGGTVMNGLLTTTTIHSLSGATIEGTMTVNGDIRIHSGALLFDSGATVRLPDLIVEKSLMILGNITIQGMAEFFGNVVIHGELILSSKQAGFALIPKSGTSVTVLFGSGGLSGMPVVTASPDVPTLYAVSKMTQTGFVIRLAGPATEDVRFSWIAIVTDQVLTQTGTVIRDTSHIFPLGSDNIPVSSDLYWNACIRNTTIFDSDGKPHSCARYHEDYTWHHPDLNLDFLWNTAVTPPLLIIPEGYASDITEDADSIRSAFSAPNGQTSEETVPDTEPETTPEEPAETPVTSTGSTEEPTSAEPVPSTEEPVTTEPAPPADEPELTINPVTTEDGTEETETPAPVEPTPAAEPADTPAEPVSEPTTKPVVTPPPAEEPATTPEPSTTPTL